MATRPPLPATPASGPRLTEITDPGETERRREREAGLTSDTPPPTPEPPPPDPDTFQFFGGTKRPLPGTERKLSDSMERALRSQADAIKRQQLEDAAHALQLQQGPPQVPPFLR